jgi:hypothetical protein
MSISPNLNSDRIPPLEPSTGQALEDRDFFHDLAAGTPLDAGAPVNPPAYVSDVDPGEKLLSTDAWEGIPAGQRLMAGDPVLEARLSALPLSGAILVATDSVLTALF